MKTNRYTALLALALLVPATTYAIPAWSRQAGASCNACHATPTWQLNATGLDFLKNGHRAEPFKMAEEIKWDHYLSLIWKGRAWYEDLDSARTGNANLQKPRTNLEQHSFALYTGGPIADRFSYFTEIYLSENTGATSGPNIVQGEAARKKLAEAFLQYNHPLNEAQDTFLAVRVGEILPAIIHVFGVGARSAEQRALPMNDSLAGNANTYKPFSRQQGLDAALTGKHYEVTVGLVNGSSTTVTNSIDADSHKDLYFSAIYNFDEHESGLGVYYYDGKFSTYTGAQDFSSTLLYKNDFYRTGVFGRFIRDNWRFVGAYLVGEETLNAAGTTADNSGYYGLIDYNFTDKHGVYVRYDFVDPNTAISRNESSMFLVGFNMLFFQSENAAVRLGIEYTNKTSYQGGNITTAGTTKYNDNRITTQLTWAF
ncbi:MAG: hypothetical protein Q8J74_11075 [Candidatus Didemnitutus sp.]|nr:hypothetical protein [Candidatus Didemnitutus sp.]